MKNSDDVLRDFQNSMDGMKGHLHILESSVPVEKQMEYFHFSEKVKKNTTIKPIPLEDQIVALGLPDTTVEEKKYFMVKLAGSADVSAYRALESYARNPDPDLSDWATMALMEARIALEAEFSDEKQIFISTGLGGKDDHLRFFSLFKSNELKPFSDYQKELIEREFSFFLEKHGGKMEKLEVKENYITLVFLIGFNMNIKLALDEAILECNQYGNFIDTTFLITNVKVYDEEEIRKELEKGDK